MALFLFLLKFLFGLAVFSAGGWVIAVFVARLLAWIFSRTIGVSIAFQLAGFNRLKDVFVTFEKGTVESILIGEVRLCLHQSLVNQGLHSFWKDQKLQLLISDFEAYLRSPAQSTKKSKPRIQSSRPLNRGTWMIIATIARHLSLYELCYVSMQNKELQDGKSLIEHFQVEIYPLRIHLTETTFIMMWEYIFPEEEQDSLKRQEVWQVSTTSASRRGKKSLSGSETIASSFLLSKESKVSGKSTIKSSASSTEAQGDIFQVRKRHNQPPNAACRPNPELRRTSSHGKLWEETVANSVPNELISHVHSSSISLENSLLNAASDNNNPSDESKNKAKDSKTLKPCHLSIEEKKAGKSQDERVSRPKKMQEFHNIRISQVELLVTYEGSRIVVSDFRLLMDTFHRDEFTGTWRRLFGKVKKHIVWGVLKSVAGMQGKKFKDKTHNLKGAHATVLPENDLNMSDSDGEQLGKSERFPVPFPKTVNSRSGDGFATSIRGLFNSQRREAKAYVLKTMRGCADHDHDEGSDGDAEFRPFARQLTIANAKKIIRRHSRKFSSRAPTSSDTDQDPDA